MIRAVLTILLLSTSSLTRSQNEAVFVPYIEAGVIDYSLSFKGEVSLPNGEVVDQINNTFYFDYMSVKFGLAATYGDFSANLYYLATNTDTDDQPAPGLPSPSDSIRWEGDRSSYSGTIAYNVTDSMSLFGGYRNSEVNGSGSFNSNYAFTHDGYFAGIGYTVDLTSSGGLTFAAGYAWLDAELDEHVAGNEFSFDGDGSGLKLGLTWRAFFNEDAGYTVGAEYFKYEYDGMNGIRGLGPLIIESLDLEEELFSLTIGLFYVF